MRSTLISAALIVAAAVAGPASAQYHQGYGYDRGYGHNQGYGRGIGQQIDQIQQRIAQSARNGRISRREANRLFDRAQRIERLHDRYAYNGLTRYEVRDLQYRIQNLRQSLRSQRQEDRYDHYGRGY